MAADRARVIASGSGDPLTGAEAARNLAVLARKAGWHSQAASIALTAAANPGLRGADARQAAERGLLIQSAAYTAARCGDRDGMRELTGRRRLARRTPRRHRLAARPRRRVHARHRRTAPDLGGKLRRGPRRGDRRRAPGSRLRACPPPSAAPGTGPTPPAPTAWQAAAILTFETAGFAVGGTAAVIGLFQDAMGLGHGDFWVGARDLSTRRCTPRISRIAAAVKGPRACGAAVSR